MRSRTGDGRPYHIGDMGGAMSGDMGWTIIPGDMELVVVVDNAWVVISVE